MISCKGGVSVSFDPRFAINGVEIVPGRKARLDDLEKAGLGPASLWRRLRRRAGYRDGRWEAADARVVCFDGAVDIYPCRHSYLDRDRRWGTGCVVKLDEDTVRGLEIRVTEGVYAAGNLFDRFVDAVGRDLGEPDHRGRRTAEWRRDGMRIRARLDDEAMNAVFEVDVDGNGNGDGR